MSGISTIEHLDHPCMKDLVSFLRENLDLWAKPSDYVWEVWTGSSHLLGRTSWLALEANYLLAQPEELQKAVLYWIAFGDVAHDPSHPQHTGICWYDEADDLLTSKYGSLLSGWSRAVLMHAVHLLTDKRLLDREVEWLDTPVKRDPGAQIIIWTRGGKVQAHTDGRTIWCYLG